jgi:hypothetical protein
MTFTIHTSTVTLPEHEQVVYFQKEYFDSQQYSNFMAFSDKHFFIAFDLNSNEAISIPRSPFGSIFCFTEKIDADIFFEKVVRHLKKIGVQNIVIKHPSECYSSFLSTDSLLKLGLKTAYIDFNQQIKLASDWEDSIHKMQQRKLQSLNEEGFRFRKMDNNEFETAHKFLTVCRQAQGLQINISLEQLLSLNKNLPGKYECFGVFRDEKISALCVAVNVTTEVAYYYLPATSPMFRNQSPMVLLISGMVKYYSKKNYKYLDLGVSSLEGKPQETLMKFKERMGAYTSEKPTFELSV